jgi:4-amino-4-deoxy-L-arabinose transferase-like glycosyltransferase
MIVMVMEIKKMSKRGRPSGLRSDSDRQGKVWPGMLSFFSQETVQVTALVLFALIMRLLWFSKEVLWLDEARYLTAVFRDSFHGILADGLARQHPPLHVIAFAYWGKMFGISQPALIAFSIVCSLVSVVLAYYIVKRLFKDRRLAFITCILLSVNVYFFHYSRDITEQMFLTMLIFASLLAFLVLIGSEPGSLRQKLLNSTLYLVSMVCLFYTHYYAFAFMLLHNVYFLISFKKSRHMLVFWIAVQVIVLAVAYPVLSAAFFDAQVNGVKAGSLSEFSSVPSELYTQSRLVFSYNLGNFDYLSDNISAVSRDVLNINIGRIAFFAVALFLVLGLVHILFDLSLLSPGMMLKRFKSRSPYQSWFKGFVKKKNIHILGFLLLLIFLPLLLTSALPVVFRIYCYVFSALVFSVFLALGVRAMPGTALKLLSLILLVGVAVAGIYSSVHDPHFYEGNENWRDAAEFLKQPGQEADMIINSASYTMIPFLFYYDHNRLEEFIRNDEPFYYLYDEGLIGVPTKSFVTADQGRRTIFQIDRFKNSLAGLDSFWLIVTPHTSAIEGRDEMLRIADEDFTINSEKIFGRITLKKYERRQQ